MQDFVHQPYGSPWGKKVSKLGLVLAGSVVLGVLVWSREML